MVEQKIIWFVWFQGKDAMPSLVKTCYDSWVKHNSDYQFIFLDENNFTDHVTIDSRIIDNKNLTRAHLSDVIRINLLNQNGGVWVDSTCLCMTALESWLPNYLNSGFFAFSKPGKDRMLSNWFLASNKGNELLSTMTEKLNSYWLVNPDIGLANNSPFRMLWSNIFSRKALSMNPSLWTTNLFTGLFKVYTYYIFHYLFEQCYKTDKGFKTIWD